ncbi:2'-5' RNA ligase family protein [Dyella flava]|uniref:2'-5' RNA ligase family protein n=1 Tax=Dyella flava TaxID=1920170 RepID=A0ABS2K039_9GAMM|nr:2'-5' RNA ligase family protein [Dyella flava]MBM7123955.1 2'-5' RNA ligase family protein [Dyella flava]
MTARKCGDTLEPGAFSLKTMLFSDALHSPAETIAAELRDYPEWHRGRTRYGVWMIPVDDPALLDYIASVQDRLADMLYPMSQRQAHLTVFVCGFECPECVMDDDFSQQQLQAQINALHLARGTSCELPLASPDSFASAAFIPVGDPQGRLATWREMLARESREVRQAAYTPHITLGLYRRVVPAEIVRQRLNEIEAPAVSLRVESLHYTTFDVRQQFGPLESQYKLTWMHHAHRAKGRPHSQCVQP